MAFPEIQGVVIFRQKEFLCQNVNRKVQEEPQPILLKKSSFRTKTAVIGLAATYFDSSCHILWYMILQRNDA